jgi:hypothetical protein
VSGAARTGSAENGMTKPGKSKVTKADDDGDGSELSQTSDIEPMVEDDDDDLGEEKKQSV